MAQIDKPNLHFNTKLYTGNGSTNAITGVGFQPDWVWIKKRDGTSNHQLFDAVRGVTKFLESSATSPDQTDTNSLTAFGTDGFTLGSSGGENSNGNTFVSWNWKANGQGSSNTDGSINTTYTSVNTTAGFSIVKWTGTGSAGTLGHGLTTTPKIIIVKNISDSVNWMVYHHSVITASATNKSFMTLNTTDSLGTNGSATTFTSVSNTTFGVGTDNIVNGSGDNMIAYCFAEKTGYSKFGSYKGNGNADGTFVYTGFKPAFVLTKNASSTSEWHIYDNKRDTDNPNSNVLSPNANYSDSISSNCDTDFLSNGFKLRNSNSNRNENGSTHIYMAFAENPIVGSNNIPATAR